MEPWTGALQKTGLDDMYNIDDINDMNDMGDMNDRVCSGNWPGCFLEGPGRPGGQGGLTGR